MNGSKKKDLAATDFVCTQRIQDLRSRPLSPNELAWLEFIRLASRDRDPAPTLERVQALRRIFSG